MIYNYIYKKPNGERVYSFKPLKDKDLKLVFQLRTKKDGKQKLHNKK
jgi:hypothetical protein